MTKTEQVRLVLKFYFIENVINGTYYDVKSYFHKIFEKCTIIMSVGKL